MDIVEAFLPEQFFVRVPEVDRPWRGRIILLLWALGYPLAMAWSLGMTEDEGMTTFYREAIAQLDDKRLIAQLVSTATSRGDGSEFSFWRLGGNTIEGSG